MGTSERIHFPHKISHKLTFAFSLLVFLVVAVGGGSLYLSGSISDVTRELKKESDRTRLLGQIYATLHQFTELVERALFTIDTLTEDQRKGSLNEIRNLLRKYRAEGSVDERATEPLWETVRYLDSISQNILKEEIDQSPGKISKPAVLSDLINTELKVQAIALSLDGIHRSRMEALIGGSTWRMRVISQLYVGFVVLALLMIAGSSWYFSRTITQPLSSLAAAHLQVAEGTLEKQITVRSKDEIGQLNQAFNLMVERLRQRDEKLQGLATLEERERLGQELHDTLVQDLAVLQMKLTEIEIELPQDPPETILEALKDMRKVTKTAYENVRQAIFGLHTMVSRGLGLIPTLTEYLHEFSAMRKISVELKVLSSKPFQLSALAEIQVIHIIHEALTNVLKHSQAKNSVVSFDLNGTYITVTIEDNGTGFDPQGATNGYHIGIQSMRTRAQRVNGRLTIESAPGKGTKVIACFPLKGSLDEFDSHSARG